MIDLRLGDCLEVMRNIPNESIDMILTSPPYDNARNYNGANNWSFQKFKSIATELNRIIKKGGVIVWIVNDSTVNYGKTGSSFMQCLFFKEIGMKIHDVMIWKKDTTSCPVKNRYVPIFEYMFILSKDRPIKFTPIEDKINKSFGSKLGGTIRRPSGKLDKRKYKNTKTVKQFGARYNIWEQPTAKNNKIKHPAIFPLKLANDHIISWSNEGDTILDCFMGSGTTGLACKNTNRNFIGIERDKNYFEIAKERLKDNQQKRLF